MDLNRERVKECASACGARIKSGWARTYKWLRVVSNGGPLDEDFGHIATLLQSRNKTLNDSMGDLAKAFGTGGPKLADDALFQLAAVDLFVEKAQAVLTARARRMSRAGVLASLTAVTALAVLAVYIVQHASVVPEGADLTRNELILRIVSAISLGAVVLVAVKYLIALARSFFHESVTLLSRRHALRFGRMYVYLNHGAMDVKELRKAFDWNRGGESSFLDIKPEEIGKTPWSTLSKSVGDAVEKGFERGTETLAKKLEDKKSAQADTAAAP
ncbi:hypothetical protein V4U86_08585 [Mycobacterium sp. AMU20-3851]|uniref:hypothetical protein n=1 Tax=Mycobacterium sp. AMU20-3851 TaxID=3122055 RepID=UPI0037546694